MTMKTKCSITGTVSLLMLIGFILMKNVLVGRVILVIVWAAHMYYFFVRVRTLKADEQ